jgi:hypothetical protein
MIGKSQYEIRLSLIDDILRCVFINFWCQFCVIQMLPFQVLLDFEPQKINEMFP